jgi:hypothetical protein
MVAESLVDPAVGLRWADIEPAFGRLVGDLLRPVVDALEEGASTWVGLVDASGKSWKYVGPTTSAFKI